MQDLIDGASLTTDAPPPAPFALLKVRLMLGREINQGCQTGKS